MSSLKAIPNALSTFIGAMGSLSIGLFSVVFIAFFFMKDSRIFKNSLLAIIPKGTENRFAQSLETINDLLSRYFLGIMLQISILFVLYTIILVSFGISNAVVIAFMRPFKYYPLRRSADWSFSNDCFINDEQSRSRS